MNRNAPEKMKSQPLSVYWCACSALIPVPSIWFWSMRFTPPPPFFSFLLARGKHALTGLKDDRRNLYQDAAALFDHLRARQVSFRNRQCLWWDFPDLLTWPQVNTPARVIRSLETYSVKRQLDGKDDPGSSDWIWVTTVPAQPVSTERAVGFGHQRWGHRESWVQRTGQKLACRPCLPARP
jgi:hypothetical protein